MAKQDEVILIDSTDNVTGTMDKIEAHQKGLLHRAISVFIFNSKGEWMLQQRALNKYHSAGLWSNACCTHPQPGESYRQAAQRRLGEEMGIDCELSEVSQLIYKAQFDNGLTEHELDRIFVGITDTLPVINAEEVHDWKYIPSDKLEADFQSDPDKYTVWFKEIYPDVKRQLKN